MNGKDLDCIVIRLGQHWLVDPRTLCTLQFSPVEERTQPTPVCFLESPSLVDDEPQPSPHFGRALGAIAEQKAMALADDSFEQRRRTQPPTLLPKRAHMSQGRNDRMIIVEAVRCGVAETPPLVSLVVHE